MLPVFAVLRSDPCCRCWRESRGVSPPSAVGCQETAAGLTVTLYRNPISELINEYNCCPRSRQRRLSKSTKDQIKYRVSQIRDYLQIGTYLDPLQPKKWPERRALWPFSTRAPRPLRIRDPIIEEEIRI